MSENPVTQRVEISFLVSPPVGQIGRAAGLSRVEVDGQTVRCMVCGSFQPLLEALRGYEVLRLTSKRARARGSKA